MGAHLIEGTFQSDKYPTTPRGKVPLSVKDKAAQDLLYEYAQRHRSIDPEFSDDLEAALRNAGYVPPELPKLAPWPESDPAVWYMPIRREEYKQLTNVCGRKPDVPCPSCGGALHAARECGPSCPFPGGPKTHEHRTCSECRTKFSSPRSV